MSQRNGLIKKRILLANDIAAIRDLLNTCNQHEHLHTHLHLEDLHTRAGDEIRDFLYYQDGKLVGYLSLYGIGTEERELVVLVHPDYRRKGIFSILFASAREECEDNGVQQLALICEHSSQAGQATIKALGARYDFSEHEMVLGDFHERGNFDERLQIRQVDEHDIDALVKIWGPHGSNAELLRLRTLRRLKNPRMRIFLATFGDESVGCDEPVGSVRLEEREQEIGIYGFAVLPEYQGRGLGRQILEETIRMVRSTSQKPLMLDVEAHNTRAKNLYLSCGFQITTTHDYYIMALPKPSAP